jgi:uncharacterized protein YcfJ
MRKSVAGAAMGVLASMGAIAQAQEVGRVISATPIVQQVAVPRQVCSNQPMVVQAPTTGAGAIMGGIAGGAIGNTVGGGSGRAAATAIGLIGGALLGNSIEGRGQQVQNTPQCTTQTSYENRTTGYDVRYEYAGREYSMQMPYDPGATVPLQVSPMASSAPPQDYAPQSAPPPAMVVPQRAVVANAPPPGYAYGYPAYPAAYPVYQAYPVYPAPAYYPPVGISLGFGFYGGGHHGHWR